MSRANCRIEGSFSPLVKARLAMRRRIAAMTDSVRVTVTLLSVTRLSVPRFDNCTAPITHTVRSNRIGLSLSPQSRLRYRPGDWPRTSIMQRATDGWGSGLLGVIIFSGSLPATRIAVGGFTPLFLTSARAVIAALLGAALLAALRQKRPGASDIGSLAIVALGVVIGFPLLTALALQHITSAHSIVFIGLLPLATALFGVIRGGERPKPAFWLFSCVGAASVAGFALTNSGFASLTGDLRMVAAILLCGLGYAEGARLSRRLGGWQVI